MAVHWTASLDDTMNKNSEAYFGKLNDHLPLVKDPTVVILRGHLLVEELLDELIAGNLKDSDAIRDARLSFYQKLCIVQGFIGRTRKENILKCRIFYCLYWHNTQYICQLVRITNYI